MKILLTGATGLLGAAFAKSAKRRGHHVVGILGQANVSVEGLASSRQLDLSDLNTLEAFVLEQFPDAIVNCAAISEPHQCAKDPATSRRLNVELPEKLALLARHLFATLIHISSEQVFDGKKSTPYSPDDKPCPPNEYAKQKLESEQRVHDLAGEFATTLRVPLLNGNSPRGDRSFHERLFQSWSRGEVTTLFTDEFRQPCLVDNAADAMVELCERHDLKGVFSWAGETTLSRFEMGQRMIAHFGLPEEIIKPSERGDDPRFAHRQACLSFDLSPLASKLKTRPQAFGDQLDALVVPKPARSWFHQL